MPDLAAKVDANMDSAAEEPEVPELTQLEPSPEPQPAPQPAPEQTPQDPNALPDPEQVAAEMPLPNQQESADLSSLRKLAGI